MRKCVIVQSKPCKFFHKSDNMLVMWSNMWVCVSLSKMCNAFCKIECESVRVSSFALACAPILEDVQDNFTLFHILIHTNT